MKTLILLIAGAALVLTAALLSLNLPAATPTRFSASASQRESAVSSLSFPASPSSPTIQKRASAPTLTSAPNPSHLTINPATPAHLGSQNFPHSQPALEPARNAALTSPKLALSGNPLATGSVNPAPITPSRELIIPNGARLPTVMTANHGSEQDLTPAEAAAAHAIADGFVQELTSDNGPSVTTSDLTSSGTLSKPAADQAWKQAVLNADERYRLFFGDDAYNSHLAAAAIAALPTPAK